MREMAGVGEIAPVADRVRVMVAQGVGEVVGPTVTLGEVVRVEDTQRDTVEEPLAVVGEGEKVGVRVLERVGEWVEEVEGLGDRVASPGLWEDTLVVPVREGMPVTLGVKEEDREGVVDWVRDTLTVPVRLGVELSDREPLRVGEVDRVGDTLPVVLVHSDAVAVVHWEVEVEGDTVAEPPLPWAVMVTRKEKQPNPPLVHVAAIVGGIKVEETDPAVESEREGVAVPVEVAVAESVAWECDGLRNKLKSRKSGSQTTVGPIMAGIQGKRPRQAQHNQSARFTLVVELTLLTGRGC